MAKPALPPDYAERVYAGVLGKIIGVYLGRPIEHMTYDQIMAELGEIRDYVHQRRGSPSLIVTDDDISGTFTFVRALPDHGYSLDLTAEQIGQSWLNYIVEGRTILWWGGLGNSTEHTAFLRLKHGIPAPRSGSAELNGVITANQIGAQIFIDGWALISPGDPAQAASLAARAASVSHDQEAVYAAQVIAAMEALAFVESDIDRLLDVALSLIPASSLIYRLNSDLREWRAAEDDWRKTYRRIVDRYGYQHFGGIVHVIPNHALIILGLLYGDGDFQKSLMITNTCGWDTDCNSGNLGCLLGIRNGLPGIDRSPVDWRGPVADRFFLPTADGGRFVTDAVRESVHLVNVARRLHREPPLLPKEGARFHFELPGSVQGFRVDGDAAVTIQNGEGHSRKGARSLQIRSVEPGPWRVVTGTFVLPYELTMKNYEIVASATLYPGQTIRAGIWADEANVDPLHPRLVILYYDADDQPSALSGPALSLTAGESGDLTWTVPALDGMPIFSVGIECEGSGQIYLDALTWSGTPHTTFGRPTGSRLPSPGPQLYRRAWVNAVDQWDGWYREAFRIGQNVGRGLLLTGAQEWQNYRVSAQIRVALAQSAGLAARVQGLRRFYALLLCADRHLRLVRVFDGEETVLAETPFAWDLWRAYDLALEVNGPRLRAWVDGKLVFDLVEPEDRLRAGSIGLLLEEGHMMTDAVTVEPV